MLFHRRSSGAHRKSPAVPAAAPDPRRVGGPRGWVVSVGVLTVLCLLGGAGALLVDAGGGSSGSAAVLPAAAERAAGRADPEAWTVATPGPPADAGDAGQGANRGGGRDDGPAVAFRVTGVTAADRTAGVTTRDVVQVGTGRLLVVPGAVAAPSAAPRMTVRIEVEEGIGAEGAGFADFVLATLNDPRSWGHGGRLTFARTSGKADFRVILASPDTSARLCAPEQTRGTLSCGGGGRVVLTMYRWTNGIPDYGEDRTSYRQYLVNHEVGHVLGHGHAYCDPGHVAPVMVQQTKGLRGCLPNPWPFPA